MVKSEAIQVSAIFQALVADRALPFQSSVSP
jgi:hypothetical protein